MSERVPVTRNDAEITDQEQALEWLRTTYGAHRSRLSGDGDRFRVRLTSVATDQLRVDRGVCTMSRCAEIEPPQAVVVQHPRSGSVRVTGRNGEVEQHSGGLVMVDSVQPYRTVWSPIDIAVMRLDLGAARKVAEAVTGVDAAQVRFELSAPLSANHARYFLNTAEYVRRSLTNDEIAASPLVCAEAFRALTTAVLSAFPNNATAALDRRPDPGTLAAEPAVVRRAAEYIDANAHRPLDLSEVAEVARIGPRGLQYAFRKYRGHSPMGYLRLARLAGAHKDLQAGDPTRGDTVARIAARWGFANAGRFAESYRKHYGSFPGVTLRG